MIKLEYNLKLTDFIFFVSTFTIANIVATAWNHIILDYTIKNHNNQFKKDASYAILITAVIIILGLILYKILLYVNKNYNK